MGVDYSGTRGVPRLELGAAVMEFIEGQNEFIGLDVLPLFRASRKAGNFTAITRETLNQLADTKRAPRGEYNRIDVGATDLSFACEENGLEGRVDDSERANYANDFDAEMATTRAVTRSVLLNQEIRIAAAVFNGTTWTGAALYTDLSSAAPWTTTTTDVSASIRTAKEVVRKNTGMEPNAVVFNQTNLNRLVANTNLSGKIQYVTRALPTELINALADYLGVQRIIISKGIKNSAKEGQTFSGGEIWSNLYCMVAVIPPVGADLLQPGIGRSFLWTEDSPNNPMVESYRENQSRSDIIRVRHTTDEVIVDPYFGHLLKIAAS